MNDSPVSPSAETAASLAVETERAVEEDRAVEVSGSAGPKSPYRVLARKYRPQSFADLIGQEALVRTLRNAIEGGRLPHAMILTGVRGVGKTTTARIIAKAINHAGPDGTAGPTVGSTEDCPICRAIAEDRHPDVIEMDAASRNGVGDIRELIEGVRYLPNEARYKVYIIDEVHMLSVPAFNALLKTLEEPPEHVIFLFATTEIRKVPVTVLSRCMRFDLRRVEQAVLAAHFKGICEKEAVTAEAEALAMIARAADGSVRDGLSLLDQAIALSEGRIDAETVKGMLGLADRARLYDLFEAVMRGAVGEALAQLGELYAVGADPLAVLQDLLELTHAVTRARLVPEGADAGLPEMERVRGRALAEALSTPVLTRTWQVLLKGIGEVQVSPSPLQAAEMVLIRLAHASDLPTPGDLVRRLSDAGQGGASATSAAPAQDPGAKSEVTARLSAPASSASQASAHAVSGGALAVSRRAALPEPEGDLRPEPQGDLRSESQGDPRPEPMGGAQPEARAVAQAEADSSEVGLDSFAAVLDLLKVKREVRLARHLSDDVYPVRFEPGRIEFRPREGAPRDLAGQLGRLLTEWTGRRWMVSVSEEAGQPTLAEEAQARKSRTLSEVKRHPLVRAALETFPGARIARLPEEPIIKILDGGDLDGEVSVEGLDGMGGDEAIYEKGSSSEEEEEA